MVDEAVEEACAMAGRRPKGRQPDWELMNVRAWGMLDEREPVEDAFRDEEASFTVCDEEDAFCDDEEHRVFLRATPVRSCV